MKKTLCLIIMIMMISLILSACSASGNSDYSAYNESESIGYEDSYAKDESASATTSNTAADLGRKVIITENYNFQTKDLDESVKKLDELINSTGCYCESSNISGNTADGGSLSYTIRVPVDKLDGFTSSLSAIGNLTSKTRSSEDVTLNYYDNESRLASYKVQQERLMELLNKAETLEDILRIEDELTDVRTEIENLTTAKNKYDNLIEYSTVNVSVSQVEVYTDPESDSFWAQLANTFQNAFSTAGTMLKYLLFLFVWFLPYLLIAGVLLVIVLVIIKLVKKKNKK